MTFLRSDLWWVAVVAVLAVVIVRWLPRRRAVAVTTLGLLTGSFYRASRVRQLPLVLVTGSLVLVGAAFLQPVLPLAEREVRATGLDIVLVIDLSLSMTQPLGFRYGTGLLAPPSQPGAARIDAVKDAVRTFISRRPGDRIGVVVFSDHSYVVSPLTFDKEHLLGYFSVIAPETLFGEGMTAVGDGIDMGTLLLRRQSRSARSNKVLIVFTDGASNLGRDPMESLQDATMFGARVHVVGVDLEEEVRRHPEVGEFIAAIRRNGGQYYAADSPADLDEASRALDRVEQGPLSLKTYVRNEPIVQWFVLPALAMLLLAVGLRVIPMFIGLH